MHRSSAPSQAGLSPSASVTGVVHQTPQYPALQAMCRKNEELLVRAESDICPSLRCVNDVVECPVKILHARIAERRYPVVVGSLGCVSTGHRPLKAARRDRGSKGRHSSFRLDGQGHQAGMNWRVRSRDRHNVPHRGRETNSRIPKRSWARTPGQPTEPWSP